MLAVFVALGRVNRPILAEHVNVPVLHFQILQQAGCHVVDGDYDICVH
jgi:hypothetical protein